MALSYSHANFFFIKPKTLKGTYNDEALLAIKQYSGSIIHMIYGQMAKVFSPLKSQ